MEGGSRAVMDDEKRVTHKCGHQPGGG